MPTAADVTALALAALLDELGELRVDQIDRIEPLDSETSARVAAATSDAMAALAAADRLDLLEAAAQRLALACIHRETPRPARAAAYTALVGLIASDLLPPASFRALNQAWDALAGSAQSSANLRDEEILLHID